MPRGDGVAAVHAARCPLLRITKGSRNCSPPVLGIRSCWERAPTSRAWRLASSAYFYDFSGFIPLILPWRIASCQASIQGTACCSAIKRRETAIVNAKSFWKSYSCRAENHVRIPSGNRLSRRNCLYRPELGQKRHIEPEKEAQTTLLAPFAPLGSLYCHNG